MLSQFSAVSEQRPSPSSFNSSTSTSTSSRTTPRVAGTLFDITDLTVTPGGSSGSESGSERRHSRRRLQIVDHNASSSSSSFQSPVFPHSEKGGVEMGSDVQSCSGSGGDMSWVEHAGGGFCSDTDPDTDTDAEKSYSRIAGRLSMNSTMSSSTS